MRSRTRLNVVLLAVVAGLAALVALAPDEHAGPEPATLTDLETSTITRVRLEIAGGEIIELERSGGDWRLTRPLEMAANGFRTAALIGVLAAPVHGRISVSERELASFGLAPPRARVTLNEQEILFGDSEPLHGRRYVRVGGETYLIDDKYFAHLSARPANFVHPAPLGPQADPRELRLPHLRVYRHDDRWRLDPPDPETSADSVTTLIDNWRHAQATAARPYDAALDWQDSLSVQLENETLDFDVAATRYELILGRRDLGIQYHLTKSAGERLMKLPAVP